MSDYYPSDDSGSFLSFASVRLGKAEAKVLSIVIITMVGRGYRNRGSLVGRAISTIRSTMAIAAARFFMDRMSHPTTE
jgi:hypothetical protein